MIVNLVQAACIKVKLSIANSDLGTDEKEKLNAKVDNIYQRAANSDSQGALESILHSDECAGIPQETAEGVLFNRICREVFKDETQSTQEKVIACARPMLSTPTPQSKAVKSLKLSEETNLGDARFEEKDDPVTKQKILPFDKIPHLKEELDQPVPPSDLYQSALQTLGSAGYKTKRAILQLSDQRIQKITGYTKYEARDFRENLIEPLKTKHESVLEKHLVNFLSSFNDESCDFNAETISELFKGDKTKETQFDTLVDNILKEGYDPEFKLSNQPTDSFGKNEKAVKLIISQARIRTFAKMKSKEADNKSSFDRLFDSLLSNIAAEKKDFINQSAMDFVYGTFQEALDKISNQVEARTIPPAKGLQSLKKELFKRLQDTKIYKEKLTPKEFKELPPRSLPADLKKSLNAELKKGKWKEGQKKTISFSNYPEDVERKLAPSIDAIFNNGDFEASALHYFTDLLIT